jgi:tetratricopeptide (TPR) repeat protein
LFGNHLDLKTSSDTDFVVGIVSDIRFGSFLRFFNSPDKKSCRGETMIQGVCGQSCRLWNSCETKWRRVEKREEQICCPIWEEFYRFNPEFPPSSSLKYPKKLMKAISLFLRGKQFVTAHHYALLLPDKDFSTLGQLREIFENAFITTNNKQYLTEGIILFQNLLNQLEKKADVLINLAILTEFEDSNEADNAILQALKADAPLHLIVRFYRKLKNQKKSIDLSRLHNISQKSENSLLQKLCNKVTEINALLKSLDCESLLLVIDRCENLLSEFGNIVSIEELGKLININLNSSITNLEKLGNKYSKSGKSEDAIKCYGGAVKGLRLFTELKQKDTSNFAHIVILLDKQLNALKITGLETEREVIIDKILSSGEMAVKFISQADEKIPYHASRHYASLFRILGEQYDRKGKSNAATICFESAVEWFNKASGKFKPPEDPVAGMRVLQTAALEKGICLRKIQKHHEAIAVYEAILSEYNEWYEGHLEKGDALMEINDYVNAESEYKRCLEINSQSIAAYDKLTCLYEKTDRYKDAVIIWTKCMKLPSHQMNKKSLNWGYFRLACLYENCGDDKVAGRLFKYIITIRQPDHLEAHDRLAAIHMRNFRWSDAIEILGEKIEVPNKSHYIAYCRLGDCYKNLGNIYKAVELYQKAEGFAPEGLPALTRLAKLYEEQSDYSKAIECLTKIINIIGDNSDAAEDYVWRSDLYIKKSDNNKACADILKAIELDPLLEKSFQRLESLPEQLYNPSVIETKINSSELYLSHLSQADPLYKKMALSLIQEYLLLRKSDNKDKALNIVDKIFPNSSLEYFTYRAQVFKKLANDLDRAIECREELLKNPSLAEEDRLKNVCILIKWHLENNNSAKAAGLVWLLEKMPIEGFWDSDIRVFREHKVSYEVITEVFLDGKDYKDALKYSDILLDKISPDDKVYLTYKGRSLIGLERYVEAERVFDYLLDKYPKDSRGHYYKGEIFFINNGDIKEAEAYFKKAKMLSRDENDNRGVISALNRLIKIHALRNDHSSVINETTELLSIDNTDVVIRLYRAISLAKLGRNEESRNDFISILSLRPGDAITVRKLLQIYGLEKGSENQTKTLRTLLYDFDTINTPEFTFNVVERLRESSVFCPDIIQFLKPVLKLHIRNSHIRSSVAHYLMRYTLHIFFTRRDMLQDIIHDIINLFQEATKGGSILFALLSEYWGSERGSYLEFYADRYENDFYYMDQMMGKIDFKNLESEKAKEAVRELQKFRNTVKSEPEPEIKVSNIEFNNDFLQKLFDYMVTTFREFRFQTRSKDYWETIKTLVANSQTKCKTTLITNCTYTLSQIATIAKLAKEDFERSLIPYHRARNILGKIVAASVDGENYRLPENEQKEINQLRMRTRSFLRTCRFQKVEEISLIEIISKVKNVFKELGMPVQFDSGNIDADDLMYGYADRIQDCIENLIFNADKAVREKFSSYTANNQIRIQFTKENGRFVICCEDTGKGMSLVEKDNFGKGKTTGLGALCIVKTVEDHNGELFVESEIGKGTMIKIFLQDLQG